MTMKRLLICGAMLLLLAAPAWAQHDDPLGKHFFPPELVMKHQRAIGLTAEQRETIKHAVQAAQETFTDAQWDLKDAMHTMGELATSNRVDEAQALDQLETILDLERQIKRAQLTLMIRIKNTLTAEQQKKLWMTAYFSEEGSGNNGDDLWPW